VVSIGSWCLGDYVPGVSDLDVAVVVDGPPPDLGGVRHEALPCPARKLELVVYRAEEAASPSRSLRFELDLNTGPGGERLLTELGDEPGHWYLIDLAIAHEHGESLSGPPAAEVLGEPPRDDVLAALVEGMMWSLDAEPDSWDTVLNASRARRFAERGEWTGKSRAHGFDDPELVRSAVAARRREAPWRSGRMRERARAFVEAAVAAVEAAR
jgi:hypothetical protein